jgi:hypothetical protein
MTADAKYHTLVDVAQEQLHIDATHGPRTNDEIAEASIGGLLVWWKWGSKNEGISGEVGSEAKGVS